MISYNKQCSESCNLSYSLLVYPICTRNAKTTFFPTFDTSSVSSVATSTPVDVIYSITQKYLFSDLLLTLYYLRMGTMIYNMWSRGSLFSFLKFWHFLLAVKQARQKLSSYVTCRAAFCQDQQFGRHHMRMRKMINFDFVAE